MKFEYRVDTGETFSIFFDEIKILISFLTEQEKNVVHQISEKLNFEKFDATLSEVGG